MRYILENKSRKAKLEYDSLEEMIDELLMYYSPKRVKNIIENVDENFIVTMKFVLKKR